MCLLQARKSTEIYTFQGQLVEPGHCLSQTDYQNGKIHQEEKKGSWKAMQKKITIKSGTNLRSMYFWSNTSPLFLVTLFNQLREITFLST